MKIRTNELTGPALDWAVAKCEGLISGGVNDDLSESHFFGGYRPSLVWAQGGPIIEREEMSVELQRKHLWGANKWKGRPMAFWRSSGETPLVAAMRCYVASKLGDEVEVPEELK